MKIQTFNKRRKGPPGYITLISVLTIGAIALGSTISIIGLGINTSKIVITYQQIYQAKALANMCAEEALEVIRESTAFAGSNTITNSDGSCDYTVTSQGGENRTIDVTGESGEAVRKIKITITNIEPLIVVSSWQEVADL